MKTKFMCFIYIVWGPNWRVSPRTWSLALVDASCDLGSKALKILNAYKSYLFYVWIVETQLFTKNLIWIIENIVLQSSAQKERSSLHGLLSLYAWKILEMLGTWHQQKDVTLAFNALAVHYTIHVFLRELNLSLATLASDPCHFTLAISNGKKNHPAAALLWGQNGMASRRGNLWRTRSSLTKTKGASLHGFQKGCCSCFGVLAYIPTISLEYIWYSFLGLFFQNVPHVLGEQRDGFFDFFRSNEALMNQVCYGI